MMKKICTKCQHEKQLIDFPIKKASKDGYGNRCKSCVKELNKEYLLKNPNYSKTYKLKNKENISEYNKKYYINNLDWFRSNEKKQMNNKWTYNNKERIKEYFKNKRKNDIIFKLSSDLRSRFYYTIKKRKKSKEIFNLLGCSVDKCKQYLESQFKPEMTWDNHGKIWEIDHIIPCSKFNLTDIEQQKQCFHYTNLQPLFKTTEIAESLGYNNEIGNRNKLNK
jgi:hypothetical protein